MKKQCTGEEIFVNFIFDKLLQNIQITLKTQQQHTQFEVQGLEQTFLQIRYTDDQQAHEKMINSLLLLGKWK